MAGKSYNEKLYFELILPMKSFSVQLIDIKRAFSSTFQAKARGGAIRMLYN